MLDVRALAAVILFVPLAACTRVQGIFAPHASCSMSADFDRPIVVPTQQGVAPAPSMQTQTITAQSALGVVRLMTFQLCTARTNKWIDDEYYREEMTSLRHASFEAMGIKDLPSEVKAAAPAAATGPSEENNEITPPRAP